MTMASSHIVNSCWLALALTVAVACGGGPEVEGELLVSAAASLTDAFAEVEADFEAANPDVDVVLNLGSSFVASGADPRGRSGDVFASANTSNMDQVVEAGEAEAER